MNFLPSKIITTTAKNPQEEEIPTARIIPTNSSSSVLASNVSKVGKEQEMKLYKRPPSNKNTIPKSLYLMQSMKENVDKLYLSKTRPELMEIYTRFILTNDKFPEDLKDPDNDRDMMARYFYSMWSRPDTKPTQIFGELLGGIEENHSTLYMEWWKRNNELNYYSSVYKALTTRLGGNGLKKVKKVKNTKRKKRRMRRTIRKTNK
jgi:hypothetical protein